MRIKLGIPYMLSEIATAASGQLNQEDRLISHITTDTRQASRNDLFIAINGGEEYLNEALRIGAFVLSEKTSSTIVVDNSSDALLDFAKFYTQNLPYILYKIGITGSVGKTTTKEFLRIILSERYKVHANEGNYNNALGLPMSILSAPQDTQVLVMEMGMNHEGEIKKLSDCLQPDIALITNIGTSHIGNLGSVEAIARAKLEITFGMSGGQLFLPYGNRLLSEYQGGLTVSTHSLDADYTLITQDSFASLFSAGEEIYTAHFHFSDKAHSQALGFSSAIAAYLGLSDDEIKKGVASISGENTRQKLVLRDNFRFLVDCYNSSYESVIALIDIAEHQYKQEKKSILLGDILELGDYSEAIHIALGLAISKYNFSKIFLIGKYAKNVMQGAVSGGFSDQRIFINEDATRYDLTANQIKSHCDTGEMILMKASRKIRLDRILEYFTRG